MTRFAVLAALVLVLGPAFASEPGQPLDCSDWVILEPGISCTTLVPYPWSGVSPSAQQLAFGTKIDNNGNGLFFTTQITGPTACDIPSSRYIRRWDLVRTTPQGAETVLASFNERCVNGSGDLIEYPWYGFDATNGRLTLAYSNRSTTDAYAYAPQRIAFTGFATLFDVLQTFNPESSTLGFRVPYMPEGMGGADLFDTYWGNLGNPIDFTQAQPLQCGYPSTPPQVGDYLTVAATLPNPPAGQGRYYITAATYQGQTRYGRKRQGTVMSGRDPSVLPACVQPEN